MYIKYVRYKIVFKFSKCRNDNNEFSRNQYLLFDRNLTTLRYTAETVK